jgi:hypothetical protein
MLYIICGFLSASSMASSNTVSYIFHEVHYTATVVGHYFIGENSVGYREPDAAFLFLPSC